MNGRRISRCLTCEKVHPPEGEEAYRLWRTGGIQVSGGSFSRPQITTKAPEERASDLFDGALHHLAAHPNNEAALAEASKTGDDWVLVTIAKLTMGAEKLPPSSAVDILDWTIRTSRGIADAKIADALQGKRPRRNS